MYGTINIQASPAFHLENIFPLLTYFTCEPVLQAALRYKPRGLLLGTYEIDILLVV